MRSVLLLYMLYDGNNIDAEDGHENVNGDAPTVRKVGVDKESSNGCQNSAFKIAPLVPLCKTKTTELEGVFE